MKYIKILIIVLNIIGVVSQYVLSLSRADNGITISQMNREANQLHIENRAIKTQLSELSSLKRVEARAKELNMQIIKSTTLSPVTVAAADIN